MNSNGRPLKLVLIVDHCTVYPSPHTLFVLLIFICTGLTLMVNETRTPTIAIIGGGVSGIVQAKWLLQHSVTANLVIFEEGVSFGGVWDVTRAHGVMDCTVCNVSKYLMELIDFPWPEDTVDFPPHPQVLQYIQNYAAQFLSEKAPLQCNFSCSVTSVVKTKDHLTIEFVDKSNVKKTLEASHVIIANGHSCSPNFPIPQTRHLPFVSHSSTYKNCTALNLKNKNVLVVGLSFSAVDIAVDLTNKGNNAVTVLTRSGSWFAPKYQDATTPSDLGLPRLFTHLPHSVQNSVLKLSMNMGYFNQNSWEISNKCDPAGGSLVSSNEFVSLVKSKDIAVIHGSLEGFANDTANATIALSSGETLSQQFDHVIFCTGYKPTFPFLSDELKEGGVATNNGFYPNLYLNMVPPHSTLLSFIGLFNVKYTSPFQVIDLQAQFIAKLLTKQLTLPSQVLMEKSIAIEIEHLRRNCRAFRGSLFLPSNYRDRLASIIGCTPHLWFVTSPKQWIQFYFGPITWAGYNLREPRLVEAARCSLDGTCERLWGRHWCFKLNVGAAVIGSIVVVVGLVILRQSVAQLPGV